ncbi:MAG TPA: hypothetical protein VGJ63_10800 [Micromonosporaceae bacterium]
MRNDVGAPGPTGPGAPPMRLLSVLAAALLATGCGQQARSPTPAPSTPARTVSVAAADRAACTLLLGRLEQVTQTLNASSELITNSLNQQQLSLRLAGQAAQLRLAADLMAQGPVPAPLATADRDLVSGLRTLTDDSRASDAAARGDLRAATDAMTDEAAVRRIVDASKTIEDRCR